MQKFTNSNFENRNFNFKIKSKMDILSNLNEKELKYIHVKFGYPHTIQYNKYNILIDENTPNPIDIDIKYTLYNGNVTVHGYSFNIYTIDREVILFMEIIVLRILNVLRFTIKSNSSIREILDKLYPNKSKNSRLGEIGVTHYVNKIIKLPNFSYKYLNYTPLFINLQFAYEYFPHIPLNHIILILSFLHAIVRIILIKSHNIGCFHTMNEINQLISNKEFFDLDFIQELENKRIYKFITNNENKIYIFIFI